MGFKTCIADCGRVAIAMVESQRPDLILLDLMMPDMNGLEVARYIRGNPFIQNIPIVLVTAYTEEIGSTSMCSIGTLVPISNGLSSAN